MKLPSSPEIKRVIAAVKSAGIEVGSVTITADCVTISIPRDSKGPQLSAYEKWKMSQDIKK